MSSQRAETGPKANGLGLKLALDDGRATVSLSRHELPLLSVCELELELAEVSASLDLDGGVEAFRDRATRVVGLRLEIDLRAWGRRLHEALWSRDVPLADLRVVGEGDHVVLEGRYGRRRAPIAYHVAFGPGVGPTVRAYLGPAHVFDVPEPGTQVLLERLGASVLSAVEAGAPRVDAQVVGRGVFQGDLVRGSLWAILPPRGWKMPRLEGLALQSVRIESARLSLGFGRAEAATPEAARRAIAWEREASAPGPLAPGLPEGRRQRLMEEGLGDESVYPQVLDVAQDVVPDLLYAAVVERRLGREDEARARFDRAAASLRSAGALRSAAWALLPGARSMALEARVARLEDAVALRPDDPEILAELIELFPRLQRAPAAIRAARRLARVSEEQAVQVEALLAAGRLLRDEQSDPEAAEKTLEGALALAPQDPTVREELALARARQGRLDAAFELMDQLIREAREAGKPRRASRLQVRAGRLWAESKEARRAVDHFRTAYDQDPGNFEALVGYFEQAGPADLVETARSFWNGIASDLPDHGPHVGRVYLAAGRLFASAEPDLARQILARARKADPQNAELLDVVLEAEEDAEALPIETWLEGVEQRFARGQDDAAIRILLLVADRRTEPLLDRLRRWIDETDRPERLRRLALVADRAKDPALARRGLEKAMARAAGPERARSAADLAVRLYASGHVADALHVLEGDERGILDALGGDEGPQAAALRLHYAVRARAFEEAADVGDELRAEFDALPAAAQVRLAADLARAYGALGRNRDRASVLREGLSRLDPSGDEATRLRGQLADAYRILGDRGGLAELRRQQAGLAQTPPPERALLLMEAARAAMASGEEQQAVFDAEAAVEAGRASHPELEQRALRLLHDLLASKGPALSEDLQRERSILRSGTVREQVVLERAALAWGDGRPEDAVQILEAGAQDFEDSDRISIRLAELLARSERSAEAAAAYAEASRRAEAAGRASLAGHLAGQAGEAFLHVDQVELARVQDLRAVELSDPPAWSSLQRLAAVAREEDDHAALARWLSALASEAEGREAALFELAQVQGLARGDWTAAGEALAQIEVAGPLGRRVLGSWLTWSRAHPLAPPPVELFDHLAAADIPRADRMWARVEGAKALRRRGAPEAAVRARVEAAVRLDPNHDEARRLRAELAQRSKDPLQRGESLLEDARRRNDPSLALEGAIALEASEDPQARARAAEAFRSLLEQGDPKLVAAVAARAASRSIRLEALAQRERRAVSSEQRWACRIARAAVRLQGDLRIDEAVEQAQRLDHAWSLLDQLGDSLSAELGALGFAAPPDPPARLAELGMESASLAEDGEAYLSWVQRRELVTSDPLLRVALWQAASSVLQRLGQAEGASQGLESVRDVAPREVEASLFELWLQAGRFEDISARLGPAFAKQAWQISQDPSAGRVLMSRLPPGAERAELLLALADVARQSEAAEEAELLARASEEGTVEQVRAALSRLEVHYDEQRDVVRRIEVQRRRADIEVDDQERIHMRLRLADALEHEMGDLQGAESELRAILALEPAHEEAQASLRALLIKTDRFDEIRAELGEDALRGVWRSILAEGDFERSFAVTDAVERGDGAGQAWWELAHRLSNQDSRRAAVLSRVVKAAGGELKARALDELRSMWAEVPPNERGRMAELMADLVSGPERAAMLVAQLGEDDDPAYVEQVLLQAYEIDPEALSIRERLARHYIARGQPELLIRHLTPAAVEPVLPHLAPEDAEAVLEARARATGVVADWLEAARRGAERDDWPAVWRRLARVLDDPPHPDGTAELLRQALTHPVESETPPLTPELVAEVLALGALPNRGVVKAVEGLLAEGGATAVAGLVRRAPGFEELAIHSLQALLQQAEGGLAIDVRMALFHLRPDDPRAATWVDWAFEEAVARHRDRVVEVAEPWLERQLASDDGAAKRAALDRLFGLGPSFRMPRFILASLWVELEAGREAAARQEAEALFDSDAAPAVVRRAAAETAVRAFSDSEDPDARRVVERAWVELCRPETVDDEGDRVVALRALAETREARGAEPMEIAQPLEAVVGLGMLPAEEIEVRRQLRELWEQAGDWARAEVHQHALATLSDDPSEWTLLAELRTWISDVEGSREALAAALAVEPNHAAALAMQFRLAEQDQNWRSAVDLLIRLGHQTQSRGRLVRAVQIAAEHLPTKLDETVRRILQVSAPEDIKHLMESIRPHLSGMEEAARDELLQAALERWPPDAASGFVRVALAERLTQRGAHGDARRILEEGLSSDLSLDHPLVQALEEKDLPESLLERAPGPVGAALAARQAERAEERRAFAEAIRLWRIATRHPTRADEARRRLDRLVAEGTASDAGSRARAALESGLPERALAMLEDAGAETDWTAIRALASLGRWADAAERLRRRASVVEGEERIRTLCALSRMSWEHLGAFSEGATSLARAAEVRPDYRLGRMATDLFLAAGQSDQARAWAERVVERLDDGDPRFGSARLGLAGVHLALGDDERALQILDGLEGEAVAVRLRVRHALERERWVEAAEAARAFTEIGVAGLELLAVEAWLSAEHLGDEAERAQVSARLQALPRLDPPGELRASWLSSVARRLAARDAELGADLLDAALRMLGSVPPRLHAELLIKSGRPESAWRLYAEEPSCAQLMFEARRSSADAAAWQAEATRLARDPRATVGEWRQLQRDAPIAVLGWPLDEVEPPTEGQAHVFDLPSTRPQGPDAEALSRWIEAAPSPEVALESLLEAVRRDPRPSLYEAIESLARRVGWRDTERAALERLLVDGGARERSRRWRRLAVCVERDDPAAAADHLVQVAERDGASRSLLHRLAHLLRRSEGPRAEADAWARFGPNDPAALSRAAVLRGQQIDDRRGALATWRAACRVRPEELSFRWGMIQQCLALGDLAEAKSEALASAELAGRLQAKRAQAAFRLTALRASEAFDGALWAQTIAEHGDEPAVLDAAVAAGRRFEVVEPLLECLQVAAETRELGPVRGRLRIARARLLERPGGRGDDAEALRRRAALEDFGSDVAASRVDGPEMTLPPLDASQAGVPLSQLELDGRLEELVQAGQARALQTDDPHLRGRFWMEVARAHGGRPDGAEAYREALEKAVRAMPLDPEALAELTLAEMRSERWAGARRSLARLAELGGPAWALGELELRAAKVALMVDDAEEAEGHLQAGLRKDPDALGGWRGLVEVARRARDAEGSRLALENLGDRLDPVLDAEELSRARAELAELELSVGEYQAARRSVERALALEARRPESLALRVRILEAGGASDAELARARVELGLETGAEARALEAADALGDTQSLERMAARLDAEGLRATLPFWRRRRDWRRVLRALADGGPKGLEAPTVEELSGCIRALGRAGEASGVFEWMSVAEELGLMASLLEQAAPGRFWFAQQAERLPPAAIEQPAVRSGLRAVARRLEDRTLQRVWAEAERRNEGPEAPTIYRRLLEEAPWDLELLDGFIRLGGGPGAEWVREFLTRGVERPPRAIPKRSLADVVEALCGERPNFGRVMEPTSKTAFEREGVGILLLETPDFGDLPIMRHHDVEADLEVRFGPEPGVWVPWTAPLEADHDAIRFLAAVEWATAVLAETNWLERAEPAVDLWALDLVPDLRAAVDVLGRWGLGQVFVSLDDPRARTEAIRDAARLTRLLRATVLMSWSDAGADES